MTPEDVSLVEGSSAAPSSTTVPVDSNEFQAIKLKLQFKLDSLLKHCEMHLAPKDELDQVSNKREREGGEGVKKGVGVKEANVVI